jgi:hypothetical protein
MGILRVVASGLVAFLATLVVGAGGGCAATDFEPYSKVASVRILATRATKPSPAAGETVELEALAFDGRQDRTRPMQLFWLPEPCVDPTNDGYFACYPALRDRYPVGVDLTPQLHNGVRMTVAIPPDVITRHSGERGNGPYGLSLVFLMACAGHVEAVPPPSGAGPEAVPFGCFDDQHHPLGPNDWVFSYSSVFSYPDRKNANPTIDHLSFSGVPVDATAGITVDHCTQAKIDDCPTSPLDTFVPDTSQELNPSNVDVNGNVLREQIWVDYFVTRGKVKEYLVILFDPRTGRLGRSADDFYAPQTAGEFLLWAVVRDDRGGATWLTVPLHAR